MNNIQTSGNGVLGGAYGKATSATSAATATATSRENLSSKVTGLTPEEVVTSLNKIARYVPGSFVGMDVIVGFPTETAEQFEDTLNILTELEWTKIHVFPYSERQGTFATRLTDIVSEQEKNRRAEVLRQLSLERYELMAKKQIGTTKEVLVLKNAAKGGHCLSRDYWPVEILGDTSILQNWQGQLVQVKVVGYQNNSKNKMEGHLTAEVIL